MRRKYIKRTRYIDPRNLEECDRKLAASKKPHIPVMSKQTRTPVWSNMSSRNEMTFLMSFQINSCHRNHLTSKSDIYIFGGMGWLNGESTEDSYPRRG